MSILEVNNLSFDIKGETRIKNATFLVDPGDVILLSGPNGSGKSTIVKILMGDLYDYDLSMNYSTTGIFYHNAKATYDILSNEGGEEFRKKVCYISQDDKLVGETLFDCFMLSIDKSNIDEKSRFVFDFALEYSLQNCFILDSKQLLSNTEKKIAQKIGIDYHYLGEKERQIIKMLALKTKQMSGGQKKLTNIITNLIRTSFCDLLILDEPLNNLDYDNVRSFSNILTKIYNKNKTIGIIIVTHCRSLPVINRVLEIKPNEKLLVKGKTQVCSTCFGEIDDDGFYI